MKIIVVNNLRFPTEKAHGYQIAKMSEALGRLGEEVELMYPQRINKITDDLFTAYHLEKTFKVKEVKMMDLFQTFLPSFLAYRLMSLMFLRRVAKLNLNKEAVIISRNPEIIWWFGRRGYKTFYDVHAWPKNYSSLLTFFLRPSAGLIANSFGTAEAGNEYGVKNILAAPNGVELADFVGREAEVSKIKEQFNLKGKTVLAYAGHFYQWKGIDTLIKAMNLLPANKYTCLLVGAGPKSLQENIITIGQVPHHEVAAYLLAADILILPTAPISIEAKRYTSPLKLFEYLAAGRAIIASDLPSSRAVVSEHEAAFFKAGEVLDLINTVEKVAADEEGRNKMGEAGHRLAANYSWEKRAKKVIDFISHV